MPTYNYDDWVDEEKEKEGKKGWSKLTTKGKVGTLKELSNLADLGKKASGQEHLIAARSAAIANTPGVKKGRSLESSMSTVDPTRNDKVESPIISDEDADYRKKKKRHGLA